MSTDDTTTAIDSGEPEVTKPLTKRQATALTKEIASKVDLTLQSVCEIKELLAKAKEGQVHITLGFPSWTGYVADTLGGKLEVSDTTRKNIIKVLAGEGMSLRAIGAATDTSKSQVQRQLSQDGTVDRPDNVTSLDGRKRPAKAAPKKAATSAPVAPLSGDPCSALEALYVVRDMQIKVNKQMAEIVEQFGYTGREKEVAVLREIWSAAQETCMAADSFIEQDQDGETQ